MITRAMMLTIVGVALLSGACASTGIGEAGEDVVRSPDRLEQPLATNVKGQCHVDGDEHQIRHFFRAPAGGEIKVTTTVADKAGVAAELLVRRPDGMFVRQAYTTPKEGVYRMHAIPSMEGEWQVVVVCRRGTSAYTMHVAVAQSLATTLR